MPRMIYLLILLFMFMSTGFAAAPRLVWKTTTNAPRNSGYCAAVFNGKIYAVMCENPNVYLYAYDPTTDAWADPVLLLSKRYEVWALLELNGKLYHYHGMENGERSTGVEEYDPVTKSSRLLTDQQENENIRRLFTFDLATHLPGSKDAWRWGPYTIQNKNYLLLTEPANFQNVYVYEQNPADSTWAQKAKMPHTRIDAGILVADDKIYTFGGWTRWSSDGATNSDLIECYDPATSAWTELGRMPQPNWAMGLAFVNEKFYLIGGMGSTNRPINSVWEMEILLNKGDNNE